MIEEGVLENGSRVQAIFGQHVQPDISAGKIGVRSGMYMASTDEIYITVHGKGGHAAAPHLLGTDTVLAASHIVVALQTLISRHCPPDVPSVLSIGRFIADGATNVIPERARLEGTFRSMNEEWRFRAHDLIRMVAVNTAEAFGARAEVDIMVGYPELYNDPEKTNFVRSTASSYVGEENVVDLERWYASEDFAWYLREVPGTFYRIGTRNEKKGIVHGLHTPRFTIDEEALRVAPGFMAFLTWKYLSDSAI
jgi:hippurate hydrolase